MSLETGTHRLGPDNATLSVRTARAGAAAKAGHDLLIHVTDLVGDASWSAAGAAGVQLELTANPSSLRVREGKGGIQALGDEDLDNIHQTIDDEVLMRREITFRSTSAEPAGDGGVIRVEGDLSLVRQQPPGHLRPQDQRCRRRRGDRRRQAERLGDEAVLGAVRGAQSGR